MTKWAVHKAARREGMRGEVSWQFHSLQCCYYYLPYLSRGITRFKKPMHEQRQHIAVMSWLQNSTRCGFNGKGVYVHIYFLACTVDILYVHT